MSWVFGILIVALGIGWLGVNVGWWERIDLANLWVFWPVLLVLFGLSLMVRRFKLGWLVMLVAILGAGIFIYLVTFSSQPPFKISRPQSGEVKRSPFSTDLPQGVTKAKITIQSGAVKIKLRSSSEKLIEGSMESSFLEPDLETTINDSQANVVLKMRQETSNWWRVKNSLEINITDKIPVEIELDAGASSLDLDCSNLILSSLNIKAGASSIDLTIGQQIQENARLSIDAGASSIEIKIPQNLGVKITADSALSSREFEGFTQTESHLYLSQNYNQSIKKVEFSINAGVSSIKVKTY
jgi:hypothetical protein